MKTILLLLITLLFISCQQEIFEQPIISSVEYSKYPFQFITGHDKHGNYIYIYYKYRYQLNYTDVIYYTNTPYKVGDRLK